MVGSLLFSPEFFDALKQNRTNHEWMRKAFDRLSAQTAVKVEKPFNISLLGGGWSHNYNCPNDGDRLTLIDRHHHKCPTCGIVWSGSPWDEVAVANEHWQYSIGCRDASVLYGITKDSMWLDWAKRVLFFYAEHYDVFPLHDKSGGTSKTSGKVQCQTLSESSWLIPLTQAYYILKQLGMLSEQEQELVSTKLFLPALEVIARNPVGISNWQTYHNAAKAWVAVAIQDGIRMDEVLNDEQNGFFFQMENSLGEDGFWYEGAWGYHFYTLEAQVMIVLAAGCFGYPIHEHPRFRSMFRTPLACMFPNKTLPPVHDSGEVDVMKYAHLFEISNWLWGEGHEVLDRSPRDSLYSLLFGMAVAVQPTEDSTVSSAWTILDLKRAGMIFVKKEKGNTADSHALMVDYGEHGGSHGHRDKLNLLYYAQGHPWLTDAGMLPYGNRVHQQYFKQTIAHNTVIVGGRSQQEAEGKLTYIRENDDDSIKVATEVDGAYPGVVLQRKTIMTAGYLLDVYKVKCDREQTIDWMIHTQGSMVPERFDSSRMPEGLLGREDGYSFLKSIRRLDGLGTQWKLEWQWDLAAHQDDRFEVYGVSYEAEETYIAETPAMPSILRRHTLIRRRNRAKNAAFITIFRACKAGDQPLSVRFDSTAGRIHITTETGQSETWEI
jgi:hypothetical protein